MEMKVKPDRFMQLLNVPCKCDKCKNISTECKLIISNVFMKDTSIEKIDANVYCAECRRDYVRTCKTDYYDADDCDITDWGDN